MIDQTTTFVVIIIAGFILFTQIGRIEKVWGALQHIFQTLYRLANLKVAFWMANVNSQKIKEIVAKVLLWIISNIGIYGILMFFRCLALSGRNRDADFWVYNFPAIAIVIMINIGLWAVIVLGAFDEG